MGKGSHHSITQRQAQVSEAFFEHFGEPSASLLEVSLLETKVRNVSGILPFPLVNRPSMACGELVVNVELEV